MQRWGKITVHCTAGALLSPAVSSALPISPRDRRCIGKVLGGFLCISIFQHAHQDFSFAIDASFEGRWHAMPLDERRHALGLPDLSCASDAQAAIDLMLMGEG